MSIYFQPTWLYIKQHNITGLKYFGKTIRDPLKYNGSGKYWTSHLKKHGKYITTVWVQLFDNEAELVQHAIEFSKTNNIVESAEWANMVIENGINSGGITGIKRSAETKEKISHARTGTKHPITEETKEKIRATLKGKTFDHMKKPKSELWYKRHTETHKGKPNHLR
jgi:hypothetical protein